MAIGEMLAESGVSIPDISGGGVLSILSKIGIVLLIGIPIAIIIIYIIYTLKFNKVIVLFKEVAGKTQMVGKDKGAFERVGTAGDYWCRTKKFKKILPRPKIQIGIEKNLLLGFKPIYWFFEREDGEWINFSLQDLDEQMKNAGAYYVDEDMRLQRLGIQKNLFDRFQKIGFWSKYGTQIAFAGFVLIVTICLILLFRDLRNVADALNGAAGAIEHLAKTLGNIKGSGVVPVG